MTKIDYQQFVFKDGKLVGKFNEMYEKSTEIPWHQDKISYSIINDIPLTILKRYKFTNVLDIGCGLGYLTDRFSKYCKNIIGIDISENAIDKARKKFSHIEFQCADICDKNFRIKTKKKFDLIICSNILWYVFEKLDILINNIKKYLRKNGCLLIIQSFPRLDKKFVGKEVIPNPEAIVEIFSKIVNLEFELIMKNHYLKEDGPIAVYLFRNGKIRNPLKI